MNPQELELQRIQTDNSFGGGAFYGRTPGGIVDLKTGALVVAPTSPGTPPAGQQNAPQASVPPPATPPPANTDGTTPPAPTTTPKPASEAQPGTPAVAGAGGVPATAAPPTSPAAPAPTPTPVSETYVVQAGDTISKIAERLKVPAGSITGYASGNPNMIRAGETLTIKRPQADTTSVDLGAQAKKETTAKAPDGTPSSGFDSSLEALLKTYGLTKPDPTQDPVTHFVENYSKVLTQLGVPDIKAQITDVIKEQATIKKEMNDAIAKVNNNPWLSSDSRQDQIAKIKERYTPQLQLATDQLQLYNSLYDKGTSQAQFIMGQITADQKTDQSNYNTVVSKAIELATKEMDAKASLMKDNQITSINGREYLVNKVTGEKIRDLGPSTKTGGESGDGLLSVTEAQALGVPYGTRKSEAFGKTPQKPLTEAQGKDLTYSQRADEANTTLKSMESIIGKYNPINFSIQKQFEANDISSPYISNEIRQVRQAERNFATAALRRESGATILPSEFITLEKQYFPRPGDDAKTLAQKAQNRQTAIDSIRASAGQAAGGVQPNSADTSYIESLKKSGKI